MKVTTDIHGLQRVAPAGMAIVEFPANAVPDRWKRNRLLLMSAFRSDHLVIHFSLPEVIFFSVFLLPASCRITTLDFFAGDKPLKGMPLIKWALGRVSRFLVYFRDSAPTAARFGLPQDRFHYIPFKINGYEFIRAANSRDEGYIFSGGRSRRDFATLFAAIGELGYPLKLLTGKESELAPHGSSMQGLTIPPNVEVIRDDASMQRFVELLTGARLVVIPILPGNATQAGIGVYLQAMAAGKCLIISSGLGVSDVITEGQAMIVAAGDVAALREAIRAAWEDGALRDGYARAALEYALPLGGEDELRKSVLRSLP